MRSAALLLTVVLSQLLFPVTDKADYYRELSDNIRLYFDVLLTLNEDYVDTANIEEMMSEGIRAMLSRTDPYTVLLKDNEIDHYNELSTGRYGGIGIYLGTSGGEKRLTVISPMDDTPASKAGLRAGDQIMFIDGNDTYGMSVRDASKFLKGEPGSKVNLKIRRYGSDGLLDFNLTRSSIELATIPYTELIDGEVGYIKITEFTGTLHADFVDEFDKLVSQGASSIIIDLRNNPGGLLESAVKLSGVFLPKNKLVVSTKARDPEKSEIKYNTYLQPADTEMPVAVLINGSSASASEIFAGAIQDHDRGVIIGEGSFGKGLVQQLFDVGNNERRNLKMTIRKYYTPSGRLIQKDDIFGDRSRNGRDTVFFKTLVNSRSLPSGTGIIPDVEIIPEKADNYISYLKMNNFFSDFIYRTFSSGDDISYGDSLPEKVAGDFSKFINASETKYSDQGMKMLDSLTSLSEDLGYNDEIREDIIRLKNRISDIKAEDFDKNLQEIERNLLMELGVYLNGTKERYRIQNRNDTVIREAVSLLKDNERYRKILGY